MKTKQIFFTSPGIAELMEKELPPVGPGDVLVKTEYTAISGGTERACLMGVPNTQGTYPISLGYSGVSEVIKTGSGVKDFEPGDRVLVYHGHHAEYCMVRPDMLTKVTDPSVPSLDAAFVIIASMSLGGVRKARIEIGENAMVMGQGILGIFAVQLCRINGAIPVIAADLKDERRKTASLLGADHTLDPGEKDFCGKVKEITAGKGVNATIEVTGSSAAMAQALDCAAWMGRVVLLGCTRVSDCPVDYYQKVHRPGISLIGAHNFVRPRHESYPGHWTHHDDCRALIKLIAGKRLKVAPVITDIFSPSEAPAVYKRLAERKDFPAGAAFRWS
ncbi:MAG: zinc-binding alcohol dehydrogenase [Eubacteriales bacterium]|nr:zinc-binding alcohol dehydrogenase [Eubacteriales bacterium]